jgi:hypothetical protein
MISSLEVIRSYLFVRYIFRKSAKVLFEIRFKVAVLSK